MEWFTEQVLCEPLPVSYDTDSSDEDLSTEIEDTRTISRWRGVLDLSTASGSERPFNICSRVNCQRGSRNQ